MWTQIAKFMGPTWGPSGSCWPQMGPMLASWTLLSGDSCEHMLHIDQYEYGLTQGVYPQWLPSCGAFMTGSGVIKSDKFWFMRTQSAKKSSNQGHFWNCDFMQFISSWISVTLIHYPWVRYTPLHEAVFRVLIQGWWFIYQKLWDRRFKYWIVICLGSWHYFNQF